jgi:hypothetical protein
LQVNLDAPVPAELGVGLGTALFLHGTCFHPERRIRRLSLLVGEDRQPVTAHSMPRLDYFRALDPPQPHSYRSGFWGLARIGPQPPGSKIELRLEAAFDGGRVETAGLRELQVAAPPEPLAPEFPGPAHEPRVVICMATYEPALDLLRRQLDSIRSQTHANWVCVISDDCSRPERFQGIQEIVGGDPRFAVSRASRRLGFYSNFERALALAPPECDYVGLADQDDYWYPDKLAILLEAIGRPSWPTATPGSSGAAVRR